LSCDRVTQREIRDQVGLATSYITSSSQHCNWYCSEQNTAKSTWMYCLIPYSTNACD